APLIGRLAQGRLESSPLSATRRGGQGVRTWPERLFRRFPVATIALSGLTPLPFFPFKALAFATGCPAGKYTAAVAARCLPRYALSTLGVAWLWAASALLVVQWFGDSLDGTLARVRRVERPRYGYYLDHIVDAFSTAAIGAGIGLSPYVNLGVALAGVLAYLILSINVYLESQAFGVFRLGYSRIGPTEARIVLVAANVALALSGPGAAVVPV